VGDAEAAEQPQPSPGRAAGAAREGGAAEDSGAAVEEVAEQTQPSPGRAAGAVCEVGGAAEDSGAAVEEAAEQTQPSPGRAAGAVGEVGGAAEGSGAAMEEAEAAEQTQPSPGRAAGAASEDGATEPPQTLPGEAAGAPAAAASTQDGGGGTAGSPDPGGGGAAGWRTGSTGSPTARGGGTPTTPADAVQPASLHLLNTDKEQTHLPRTKKRTLKPSSLGEVTWKPPWSHEARVQQGQVVMNKKDQVITRNPDTDLLSMVREQVKPPRTERRMLEPSSMGEMTWKPPWSPNVSVQQGQDAADKEMWDPGGTTVDQLTAFYQAAFPAIGLTRPPPWRREKQGGYNVRKIAVTDRPPDHPDGRPDCIQKRGMNLSPSPPRMNDGPRHGPPYISSVDLQGTHSTTDQRGR